MNFLDKIIFATGVLIFLQVPAFINQYTHRVIGYHEALSENVERYQKIANINYDGNLSQLINDFRKNDNEAIRQTAEKIEDSIKRSESYKNDYLTLTQNSLFSNILYLTTHLHIDLIQNASQAFQPNITLNLDSVICGLFGGLLFSLIFHCFLFCLGLLGNKSRQGNGHKLYLKTRKNESFWS